ncbi:hypothetical protein Tsubulata_006030 [Turnera subulata]|uniref:Uncharacterized protein n=1 Tax=Turnera subulata TaxID=218843 RepID=A0A9Q0JMS6_9ROSI|nr:hypothetical protein Tsubulata_006030 [Turnera subulata]
MASGGSLTVSTSPKGSNNVEGNTVSPKGHHHQQQCLCSPTTHQGSFRCRFHRANPSSWKMRRSNSMPTNKVAAPFSPKSVESAS